MWWLIPVLSITGLLLYAWAKTHNRLYKTVERFYDGPPAFPILGNSLTMPLDSEGFYNMLLRHAKEFDRVFRIWLGPHPFIVFYEPKDVEVILGNNTHITKGETYKFTLPWIGTGLLTSTGTKWKSRRKIITPTFHFKTLEDFVGVFHANGEILMKTLRGKINKPTFDVLPIIRLYALDNICETAMGVSVNAQKDSNSAYVRSIKAMCEIVMLRIFKPWLASDFIFYWTKHGERQRKALQVLHSFTLKTINQRREENKARKLENQEPETIDDFYSKKRLAFLDLLLETAEDSGLSVQDVQEEVDTFMFEGHDTVSSGISFALYALSQHPEIQEKAFEEQVEIMGDGSQPITFNDCNKMKYLERIIKESQRLYPSGPVISRYMHQDLQLSKLQKNPL